MLVPGSECEVAGWAGSGTGAAMEEAVGARPLVVVGGGGGCAVAEVVVVEEGSAGGVSG